MSNRTVQATPASLRDDLLGFLSGILEGVAEAAAGETLTTETVERWGKGLHGIAAAADLMDQMDRRPDPELRMEP